MEGVKGAPIHDLVRVAVMAAKQTFIQFLYRKERGKFRSIVSRFDVREEVVTILFISRFEGGSRVTDHEGPDWMPGKIMISAGGVGWGLIIVHRDFSQFTGAQNIF